MQMEFDLIIDSINIDGDNGEFSKEMRGVL